MSVRTKEERNSIIDQMRGRRPDLVPINARETVLAYEETVQALEAQLAEANAKLGESLQRENDALNKLANIEAALVTIKDIALKQAPSARNMVRVALCIADFYKGQ